MRFEVYKKASILIAVIIGAFGVSCEDKAPADSTQTVDCSNLERCGDQCVDLSTSEANCGMCGHRCNIDATCIDGVCSEVSDGSRPLDSSGGFTGGTESMAGVGGSTGGFLGASGGAGGTVFGTDGSVDPYDARSGYDGSSDGGSSDDGSTDGGSSDGGPTDGSSVDFPFILGADISSVQETSASFRDTDGQNKSIFDLLKNHGFNYVRLRTFVDPMAPYGYASSANGCDGRSEAFGDRDHIVQYGRQVKSAGMGFLLDFHYSDVWADPGNQIIPEAWRAASSITELATMLKTYTIDVLTTAVDAGARPDMVQIGNEITGGMLMHVPGPETDCWGNNPQSAPIGGAVSNWENLAILLTAGIEGVREVDSEIKTVLHIDNTDDIAGVKWWVQNARSHGVDFDVLGLSCYTVWQGTPDVWRNTYTDLATTYPDLQFIIAEYNPERQQANLIMKNLEEGRGLGTFFWEPSMSGAWGTALFSWQDGVWVANSDDFAEYDALLPQLGL